MLIIFLFNAYDFCVSSDGNKIIKKYTCTNIFLSVHVNSCA